MKNESDDFSIRKEIRRSKIKNKKKKYTSADEDPLEAKLRKQSEYKKIKQDFEEEEWEDWDRYYNH
jgi:hypothetical protein